MLVRRPQAGRLRRCPPSNPSPPADTALSRTPSSIPAALRPSPASVSSAPASRDPPKLADGFAAIEAHLSRLGRPPTAFCACELRSPAQFTDAGFVAFNRHYVAAAGDVGDLPRRGQPGGALECLSRDRPAGRAGVLCLQLHGAERRRRGPRFVCAGSGEAREGGASYADRIIRLGDHSPDGMREKARFVLGEMERRMAALGFGWADVTATQLYTVYDVHPFLADEFVRRGAARAGLTWHYARPPVQGLDYEMDVRGLARELVI